MSTMSAYHDLDGPQPEDRDPTPEEMMPIEEEMLEKVRQMQVAILARFDLGQDLNEAMRCCRGLKAYLNQAIADRDRIDERDMDIDADFTDPFDDEP